MNAVRDVDLTADSLLTSYQVGALLQVNPSSVNKWVKDGRLPAFRTPGGHRRIRAGDLVQFLNTHHMPLPDLLEQAAVRRVLLIDSDPHHIGHVRNSLKDHSGQVALACASHSIQALLELGVHRPHVVLISCNSGPLDCLELCRQLHAHADTKLIDIYVLGRAEDPSFAQQAAAAGARAVLPHDASEAELHKAIGIRA